MFELVLCLCDKEVKKVLKNVYTNNDERMSVDLYEISLCRLKFHMNISEIVFNKHK